MWLGLDLAVSIIRAGTRPRLIRALAQGWEGTPRRGSAHLAEVGGQGWRAPCLLCAGSLCYGQDGPGYSAVMSGPGVSQLLLTVPSFSLPRSLPQDQMRAS